MGYIKGDTRSLDYSSYGMSMRVAVLFLSEFPSNVMGGLSPKP